MRHFRFLLLTLGVLLALLLSPSETFRAPQGYADWDCSSPRPYGWVRSDMVFADPTEAVAIAAHEEQHVRDFMVFSSCKRFKAYDKLAGKEFRKYIEARAYCESARVTVSAGRHTMDEAITYWASRMTLPAYGFDLTQEQAEAEVRAYCSET